jgi:hypothetical protein
MEKRFADGNNFHRFSNCERHTELSSGKGAGREALTFPFSFDMSFSPPIKVKPVFSKERVTFFFVASTASAHTPTLGLKEFERQVCLMHLLRWWYSSLAPYSLSLSLSPPSCHVCALYVCQAFIWKHDADFLIAHSTHLIESLRSEAIRYFRDLDTFRASRPQQPFSIHTVPLPFSFMFQNRDAPYDPVENPPVFKFEQIVPPPSEVETDIKSIASESAENCDVTQNSCDEHTSTSESTNLNSGSELSIPFDSFRFASLIVAVRSGHLVTAYVIPNDPEYTTDNHQQSEKGKEDIPKEKVTIETTVTLLNESESVFSEMEIEEVTHQPTDRHVHSSSPSSSSSSTQEPSPLAVQKSVTAILEDMSPHDYHFTMLLRKPLSSWIRWQRLPSGDFQSFLLIFDLF